MPSQYVTFTVEVTARVDADEYREDYGVSGSPVWYEYEVTDVSGIEIEGISVDNLPKELQDVIEDMAAEAAIDGDWE